MWRNKYLSSFCKTKAKVLRIVFFALKCEKRRCSQHQRLSISNVYSQYTVDVIFECVGMIARSRYICKYAVTLDNSVDRFYIFVTFCHIDIDIVSCARTAILGVWLGLEFLLVTFCHSDCL